MESQIDENALLVFMDECGDHSVERIDPDFPILLLAFVIVEKKAYSSQIIPAVGRLKLRFWPHEGVNLHSRDIRKQLGDFRQFHHEPYRIRLMHDVTELIISTPFDLIVACIHKTEATKNTRTAPYHQALREGLCLVARHAKLLAKTSVTLVAEARGKREDRELNAWLTSHATCEDRITIRWVMRSKRDNVAGLQVADLCAYPAARHALKPMSANPAFEVVRQHLVGWSENKKGGDA
jgi:hypothetical protein